MTDKATYFTEGKRTKEDLHQALLRSAQPCEHGWECPHDCCWIWTKAKDPSGYGVYGGFANELGQRSITAHRAMKLAHSTTGFIPEGVEVDHNCHDPKVCQEGKNCPHRPCVRPKHLRLLRESDNKANLSTNVWNQLECPRCGTAMTEANTLPERYFPRCRACYYSRKAAIHERATTRTRPAAGPGQDPQPRGQARGRQRSVPAVRHAQEGRSQSLT